MVDRPVDGETEMTQVLKQTMREIADDRRAIIEQIENADTQHVLLQIIAQGIAEVMLLLREEHARRKAATIAETHGS